MIISGTKTWILSILLLFVFSENKAQRFNTNTSTDCGILNINFSIKGGLAFCEGDTITLVNVTDSVFDYFVIDWSHGPLDTVYDKKDVKHVYYFPDSVLCPAPPLAVYMIGIRNCGNNKQTRVWGAYGINHIYRPKADFGFQLDSVCFGKTACMKSKACNADSIVWKFDNVSTSLDSCYIFNTPGQRLVQMFAYNKCNSDSATRTINIIEYPSAKVNVSSNVKNNAVCKGDTVVLMNASNQWSNTEWVFPAFNDKVWKLDTAISNKEKSLPLDTIIYFDTIRFVVLDTGILKFRMLSLNSCDSITWDYNLRVVEPAKLRFSMPPRFCDTALLSPQVFVTGVVDRYNWFFPGAVPSSSTLANPQDILYNTPGIYTVTLRTTNICGSSVDSFQIIIDKKPVLTIDSFKNPICKSEGIIRLKANVPFGLWTGNGIDSNGLFNASALGAGNYDFTYTTQSGGCLLSKTITIGIVDSTPIISTPLLLCGNTVPTLINVSPAGGIYSGPGVNSFGYFDPSVTGLGDFLVKYSYKDVNGCNSTAHIKVTVTTPPKISKKDTLTYCMGTTNINLLQDFNVSANPSGGKYNLFINGKAVNPIISSLSYSPGVYKFVIQYVLDLCIAQDSAIIQFIQAPVLSVSNDTILCDRNDIFRLKTSHPGGIWTGPGVNPTTGLIDLRAVGRDTAIYFYRFVFGLNCETTAQCTVIIDDKGKGIHAGKDVSFCKDNRGLFTLAGFSPSGGRWTGPGIVNDSLGIIDVSNFATDSNFSFKYCFEKAFNSPCTFCDSMVLRIHSLPTADFDIIGVACLGIEFNLQNNSNNANSYFWDFGDMKTIQDTSNLKNPKYRYTDTGIHVLKLIAKNQFGCTDTISKIIDVKPNPPVASFSIDSTMGCAPFVLSLQNHSSGDNVNYIWKVAGKTFTDSLPLIVIDGITSDSSFKIELIVANGCGAVSDSDFVMVRPYPIVNFGIDSFDGCTPVEINFSNTSVGNPDFFIWNMGNGNNYNSKNPPKQIYTTNDTSQTIYQITLIGVNECGSDTLIKEITVNPPNVSAFIELSKTRICQYDSLLLKSFATPGSRIDWKIIHPSGLISTANTSQTYFYFDTPGNYTILLHAAACGEDYDTAFITVLPAPVVNFDLPAYLCLNDTAFFVNTSINTSSSLWDFGDGTTSTRTHPFHKYAAPGTYTIKLTGFSSINNCPFTITKKLVVIGAPTAQFTTSVISGCAPLYVNFTNQSIGATKYIWTFSDNTSNSLEKDPGHLFTQAGIYNVILQVLDTNQCFSDTALLTIRAFPSPEASFDYSNKNYCLGKDTLFLNNTSKGAAAHQWQIGNSGSTDINPFFIPQDTGWLDIRLISSNIFSCSDTATARVRVVPSPKAIFTLDKDNGCEDLQIQMNNLSQYASNYVWHFGDQNTSTLISPSHLYKIPGKYEIRLISLGNSGCPPDTAKQEINVWPLPNADFQIIRDSLCGVPMHIRFTNASINGANYNWVLDSKLISTNTETEYIFDKTGDYTLSLNILSAYGCADSVTKTISIFERPVADFSLDPEACENTFIQFHNHSKHSKSYEWYIEGLGYSNEFEPEIRFQKAGSYNVQLIASYNALCRDTLLKKGLIKIYQQPMADFSYEVDVDKTISGDVQFTNLSKNYTDQKWFFGDGLFTLLDNPLHIYSANQSVQATLYVYHRNGGLFTCVDSISKSIGPLWITTFYAPNAFSPDYGEGDVRFFKPVGLGLAHYEISVYSPWGERVWYSDALENNSPSAAWDGVYKGGLVPQGSYTWLAKLTFINGNKKIEKGTVTVLR